MEETINVFLEDYWKPERAEISFNPESKEFTATYYDRRDKVKRTLSGSKLSDVYEYNGVAWCIAKNNPATEEEILRCLRVNDK